MPSSGEDAVHVEWTEDGQVAMSHTSQGGLTLRFTPDEWNAFITGCKRGEFDPDPESGSVLDTYQRVTGLDPLVIGTSWQDVLPEE